MSVMHIPADGSVLATFYAGIGDTIVNGPFIRTLHRLFGDRLIVPDTLGMELLALDSDAGAIRTLPAHFRQLYVLTPADAVAALRSVGIVAILNFRRDRVVEAQAYTRFTEVLDQHGIMHWDASNLMPFPEQTRVHTAEFSAHFLRSLGVPLRQHDIAWLVPFVTSTHGPMGPESRIGVYLGASVPIKRFSPTFWDEILRTIAAQRTVRFVLLGGVSPAEATTASTLSAMLRDGGVSHTLLRPTSLTNLARVFRQLHGVLTGDTFALSLAEALDVPVVSIHCATDPVIYGVQRRTNRSVMSSFYHDCPEKNVVGNCDGWTHGCRHVTCQRHVSASLVAGAVHDVIPRGDS